MTIDKETDDEAFGCSNDSRHREMEDLLACTGKVRQHHDHDASSDEENADLSLSPAAEMAKYVLCIKNLAKKHGYSGVEEGQYY